MVQTIDRIKGCVVLSKHEVGAIPLSPPRRVEGAHGGTSSPVRRNGPEGAPDLPQKVLAPAPLVVLCLLSVDTERRAPPARRSKRWLENHKKG